MKVLQINTYDTGGAAKACIRLHLGLLNENIESKLLLKKKTTDIPNAAQISISTLKNRFKYSINLRLRRLNLVPEIPEKKISKKLHRHKNLDFISLPFSEYDLTKSNLYTEANIINLHWVGQFLDYPTFFKKNHKPLVWTFHDQNPFLGLEHFNEKIIGIDSKGYPVKRKITNKEKKVFDKYLAVKIQAYKYLEKTKYKIITPSKWLKETATESGIFEEKNIIHIPYGINQNIFKPTEKKLAKSILNIPLNKTAILFVADSITNFRKGFAFLAKVLEDLKDKDIILLSLGHGKAKINSFLTHIYMGFIQNEYFMSLVYSAADVFVIPSLMDNLPNTALESIMCGTPVVGFPVGGIKDIVEEGRNGYLADEISSVALKKSILKFIETKDNFDSEIIRKYAIEKYGLERQAKKYMEIYKDLLK